MPRVRDDGREEEDHALEYRVELSVAQLQRIEAARVAMQAAREAVEIVNICTKTSMDPIRKLSFTWFLSMTRRSRDRRWGMLVKNTCYSFFWARVGNLCLWKRAQGWSGWHGRHKRFEDKLYGMYVKQCRCHNLKARSQLDYERDVFEPPFVQREVVKEGRRSKRNVGQCPEGTEKQPEKVREAWYQYTNQRWKNMGWAARPAQELGQLRMMTHTKGHVMWNPRGHVIIRVCMCGWGVAGADTAVAMMLHRTVCSSQREISTTRFYVKEYQVAMICWAPEARYLQKRPNLKAPRYRPFGRMVRWWHDVLGVTPDTLMFTSPCPSQTRMQIISGGVNYHGGKKWDIPWTLKNLSDDPRPEDLPPCPTYPANMETMYRTIVAATYLVGGQGMEATLWLASEDIPGKVDDRTPIRCQHLYLDGWQQNRTAIPEGYTATLCRGTSPTAAASWTMRQAICGSSLAKYLVYKEMYDMIEPGLTRRYGAVVDTIEIKDGAVKSRCVRRKENVMLMQGMPPPGRAIGGRHRHIQMTDRRWNSYIHLTKSGLCSIWSGITYYRECFFMCMLNYDHGKPAGSQKDHREVPMRVKAREDGLNAERNESYHSNSTEWMLEQKIGMAWLDMGKRVMGYCNSRAWFPIGDWKSTRVMTEERSRERTDGGFLWGLDQVPIRDQGQTACRRTRQEHVREATEMGRSTSATERSTAIHPNVTRWLERNEGRLLREEQANSAGGDDVREPTLG